MKAHYESRLKVWGFFFCLFSCAASVRRLTSFVQFVTFKSI